MEMELFVFHVHPFYLPASCQRISVRKRCSVDTCSSTGYLTNKYVIEIEDDLCQETWC